MKVVGVVFSVWLEVHFGESWNKEKVQLQRYLTGEVMLNVDQNKWTLSHFLPLDREKSMVIRAT